jgi:Tol biopolymer transport system component
MRRPLAPRLGLAAAGAAVVVAGCAGSSGDERTGASDGDTRPQRARTSQAATAAQSPAAGPRTIAFVRSDGRAYAIFVMREDGSRQHRLTHVRARPSSGLPLFFEEAPAWSRDGKHIAFSSNRSGTSAIYVMRADGTGTHRLTRGGSGAYAPSWAPNGRRLVFYRGTGRGVAHLYVINADGSNARPLTRDASARDYDPAWSPDGTRIAFARNRPGSGAIYTVRPDGTGLRRLTRFGEAAYSPAWSPDGRRLAYSRGARGEYHILVVNRDGTAPRELTRGPTDFNPSWSPSGREIAFSRNATIYVMRADGSHVRRLTSKTIDDGPVWQPQ